MTRENKPATQAMARCEHCAQSLTKVLKCAKCSNAVYCGRECQGPGKELAHATLRANTSMPVRVRASEIVGA